MSIGQKYILLNVPVEQIYILRNELICKHTLYEISVRTNTNKHSVAWAYGKKNSLHKAPRGKYACMQILLKVTPRPFSIRMDLGQLLRKYSKCVWTKTLQKFTYGQYVAKPILFTTNQYKGLKSSLSPLKESQ